MISKFFTFKKKSFAVFLMLLIASGIFFPNIGLAANDRGWNNSTDRSIITGSLGQQAETAEMDGEITKELGFFQSLLIVIGQLIVNGAYKIAALSAIFFSYIIANLDKAITTDPNFIPAWQSVRNLANMIIVLGFVIVGVATTLRIQDYTAKKLLPKLIIIALLVNFSSLFVGLFIDASNIVVGSAGGTSSGMMPITILIKLRGASMNYLNPQLTLESGKFLGSCALFAFVFIGVALTFLYASFILFARYAVLIMLYILSPLAFVFWVFPSSKKLWTDWWNHFLKWCFIGVFSSFVLWLTSIIIGTQAVLKAGTAVSSDLSQLFISCIIVLAFLYVGFKMTTRSSGLAAMAAGGAMSLASGGLDIALGAAKFTGKAALDRSGATRMGSTLKDSATGALEKMNILQQGYTKNAQQKRLELAKGLENKYENNEQGNKELARIASGKGVGAGMGVMAAVNKAKATEILQKRNAFGYVSDEKQASAVAHYRAMGGETETFKDRQDLLGAYKEGSVGQLQRAGQAAASSLGGKTVVGAAKAVKGIAKGAKKVYRDPQGAAQAASKVIGETIVGMPKSAAEAARKATQDPLTQKTIQKLRDDERLRQEGIGATAEDAEKAANAYMPSQDAINAARGGIIKEQSRQQKIGYVPPAENEVNQQLARSGITNPTFTQYKNAEKDLATQKIHQKIIGFNAASENDARNHLIAEETKSLRANPANNTLSAKQIDKLATNNVNGSIATNPNLVETTRQALTRENKIKETKKLTVSKLREMPEFDADIIENSNLGTLDRAWLEFTTEQKDKCRAVAPELSDKALVLLRVPGTNAAQRKANYNVLNAAGKSALFGAISPADQEKVNDYSRKIAVISR